MLHAALRLAHEPRDDLRLRQHLRTEELEGNPFVELDVACAGDDADAALSEEGLDEVLTVDHVTDGDRHAARAVRSDPRTDTADRSVDVGRPGHFGLLGHVHLAT